MTDKPPSDEELVALDRRIYRSNMAWSLGLMLAMAVLIFVGLWLANAGLLPWTIFTTLLLAVPPIFLGALLFNLWRHRSPKEARSEQFLRRHSDEMLARWRPIYPLFWFMLAMFAWDQSHRPKDAFGVSTIAFVAFMIAAMTCFGPGWGRAKMRNAFSDELITALRRRAGFAGYLAVMLLLGLSYVAAFYRPGWAPRLILWTLVIGAVAPQLYYLVSEIRAERGG